jgi:hypothetical protein
MIYAIYVSKSESMSVCQIHLYYFSAFFRSTCNCKVTGEIMEYLLKEFNANKRRQIF